MTRSWLKLRRGKPHTERGAADEAGVAVGGTTEGGGTITAPVATGAAHHTTATTGEAGTAGAEAEAGEGGVALPEAPGAGVAPMIHIGELIAADVTPPPGVTPGAVGIATRTGTPAPGAAAGAAGGAEVEAGPEPEAGVLTGRPRRGGELSRMAGFGNQKQRETRRPTARIRRRCSR